MSSTILKPLDMIRGFAKKVNLKMKIWKRTKQEKGFYVI